MTSKAVQIQDEERTPHPQECGWGLVELGVTYPVALSQDDSLAPRERTGKDWRAGSSRMRWKPQWGLQKWKDCSRARGQRRPKLERQQGAIADLRHLVGNEVTALYC